MLTLDGNQGEGGGQILRSALTLAMLTQKPFRIENIRAGRKKPGLLQQHLTAVQAAARIAQAHVLGAELGSRALTFTPNEIAAGKYEFAVTTAGSAMLVLQTVLLPLVLASAPSQLTLTGGTHNPAAPPFDFMQKTFLPLLNRMGGRVEAKLLRHGFYPAGGGKIEVSIQPTPTLAPLVLQDAGAMRSRFAKIIVSDLPRHIAEREAKIIAEHMSLRPHEIEIAELRCGPGNVAMIEIARSSLTEVFTAFGERGVRAETVAQRVVDEAQKYLAANVPVGEHLADQLLVPIAAAATGSFLTMPLSSHAQTNLAVLKQFWEVEVKVEEINERQTLVRMKRSE